MVKVILGYDIKPGITVKEFEKWLREIHLPDLRKIPGLKKVVFNTVKAAVMGDATFYRISELHFDHIEAFEKGQKWRQENPFLGERDPKGVLINKLYKYNRHVILYG
jgi:uncharacterized protein (TIGR02118 family)